jgi:hypothetical protein
MKIDWSQYTADEIVESLESMPRCIGRWQSDTSDLDESLRVEFTKYEASFLDGECQVHIEIYGGSVQICT